MLVSDIGCIKAEMLCLLCIILAGRFCSAVSTWCNWSHCWHRSGF